MAYRIGEQLKQSRLKRGLTLEQVSQATHIRKHYLEALENDQREALPSPVQGRGFLRLYAGHLDLPVADMLAAWDGKLPPEQPTAVHAEGKEQKAAADSSFLPADGVAAAAAAGTPTVPSAGAAGQSLEPAGLSSGDADAAPVFPIQVNPAFNETSLDLPVEPSSSQAIFRAIGLDLRKQRESLGLSRAEVERFTRLRQHYIQAMEEGRIDQLPSPVQGRGMLSNYAAFLNMDEELVLLRFAEGLQARRIERIPKPEPGTVASRKRPARQAPFWRRFLTPDLIFGIGVAGIILFFVLWTSARISNLRTAQARPTPPGIAEVLLTPRDALTGTPVSLSTTGGTQVAGAIAETIEPPTVTPVNDPNQDITPLDITMSPPAGEQANPNNPSLALTEPAVTSPTLAPINNDPLQVYIVAHQRAWLRVLADDKLKFLGRTIPGNAYAFSGARRIELLTGNAAGIQVYYNQTDLGILGQPGQVVGLVFVPDGIATPTAAFTATPTATLLATITPLPTASPQATPTITPYVPEK